MLAGERAQRARADAEEAVALAVLTGTGLEVPLRALGVGGIGERLEVAQDRARRYRRRQSTIAPQGAPFAANCAGTVD